MAIPTLNDGTHNAPALRIYLNSGTLGALPDWSLWNTENQELGWFERIKAAGFEGVQGCKPEDAKAAGMGVAGGGRIDHPGEALEKAIQMRDAGFECATVHVGTGFETDAEMDAFAEAIIAASGQTGFPLYVETHRATLTQDIWRTVQWVERHPDLRINADFSHWYAGHEMVYGNWEKKMAFMQPVFERTRFFHGRIASPGCLQVDVGPAGDGGLQILGRNFVEDFRRMWTEAMTGFLKNAGPGDYLVFAPELLQGGIYYARKFVDANGELREECDRFAQAIVYAQIARECFAAAQKAMQGG